MPRAGMVHAGPEGETAVQASWFRVLQPQVSRKCARLAVFNRPTDIMPLQPYSYRSDPAVPPFDDSVPLIIFDGYCVLCSTGIDWMLKRDPNGTTRFAAIQQPVPQALYRHYGLDASLFDTFMVLDNGVPSTKWAGALAAARTLPQPWRTLGALGRIIPQAIGNPIYDWVQRNRIGWFGKRETCRMPNAAESHRFL